MPSDSSNYIELFIRQGLDTISRLQENVHTLMADLNVRSGEIDRLRSDSDNLADSLRRVQEWVAKAKPALEGIEADRKDARRRGRDLAFEVIKYLTIAGLGAVGALIAFWLREKGVTE